MSDTSSQNTSARQSGRPHPAIPFLIGAATVGLIWFMSHANVPTVKYVTIDYMYETSPGSAEGGVLHADSVVFYPGYIVVTHTGGHGNVFSVDRLRNFSYTPRQ